DAGQPQWYRQAAGPGDMRVAAAADGTFSVSTGDLALLELLPDPRQDSYFFSVEVRHDNYYGKTSEVGIYVGHSTQLTGQGQRVDFFCGLGFNDKLMPAADSASLPKRNPVQLTVQRRGPENTPPHRTLCSQDRFTPTGFTQDPGTWRKLAVKVTPE